MNNHTKMGEMMDKKSCKNCFNITCRYFNRETIPDKCVTNKWQRNPDKWLAILPEEKDLLPNRVATPFFWRASAQSKAWLILFLFASSGIVMNHPDGSPIAYYGGEWQGPIVPKEDK